MFNRRRYGDLCYYIFESALIIFFLIQNAAYEVDIQILMSRCENFSFPLSPAPGPGCPHVVFDGPCVHEVASPTADPGCPNVDMDGPCVRAVAQRSNTVVIFVPFAIALWAIYEFCCRMV